MQSWRVPTITAPHNIHRNNYNYAGIVATRGKPAGLVATSDDWRKLYRPHIVYISVHCTSYDLVFHFKRLEINNSITIKTVVNIIAFNLYETS